MPSNNPRTEKQRRRLLDLLNQLFQLDQPDLDFGFYKIMHAKTATVSDFLQKDLLNIIDDICGEVEETELENARREYEAVVEQARKFNPLNPEESQPVMEAKEKYEAAKESGANESGIYEHLYRFFERYYENGDFLSRRYYGRETPGKAAPYAVPYDGREVYLHWANRDQYYIKTSEHLSNFTVDLANAKELPEHMFKQESLKLHCRIVSAAEGEHNNNKATDKTERFFLIHPDQPAVMENGDLVLQFEYRPDSEKSGQASKWQKTRLDEAESAILKVLAGMTDAASHHQILQMQIGELNNKRTMLRKYLNQYTKRNTMDYFIHKDLNGFLMRELDFYIKNEMLPLDSIVNADAQDTQSYLDKIKAMRKIATHLISMLAQSEEFQKKLWLKKKFVTETNYCITLDRIPQTFYPEIAANKAQRREWQTLFAIDELDGYSASLSKKFLVANPYLVLDTAFFSADFKDALLASIQDLDNNLDGLLIHSENFQALDLMQKKYEEQVKCIYIDPPYNTGNDGFVYKDSYQHSGWLSMMENRLVQAKGKLCKNGFFYCQISDIELINLNKLLIVVFGNENYKENITLLTSSKSGVNAVNVKRGERLFKIKEYIQFFTKDPSTRFTPFYTPTEYNTNYKFEITKEEMGYKVTDLKDKFKDVNKLIAYCLSHPQNIYSIETNNKSAGQKIQEALIENKKSGNVEEYVDSFGGAKLFYRGGVCVPLSERIVSDNGKPKFGVLASDIWDDIGQAGNNEGGMRFENGKKPLKLLNRIIQMSNFNDTDTILDYFAGSGTTGHAVVDLNREDDGKRKYVMIEMGNYFDAVTKPRMQKAVYSQKWAGDKPVARNGVSHAFKYLRLESYEDALNNLYLKEDETRQEALKDNDALRHNYMLKYWLNFETQDSQSLLNILLFDDPTRYTLSVKKPGSDEQEERKVDLPETFNWLIGLHVDHADQWRRYSGSFTRERDPELPDDKNTRLILKGKMKETSSGKWQFRKIEGRVCRTPGSMEDMQRVLVIWRKLTGNVEEDNVMLDEWFKQYRKSANGNMPDVIYVNGGHNLDLLRTKGEHWKVCLTEYTFHTQMWNSEE